jgi:hypothetical protein
VVYIEEAHPSDGRQVPQNVKDKVIVKNPTTDEERAKVAADFAKDNTITLPVLLDKLDNKVSADYAAWPDRLYVVGRDGKIAYKGGLGPTGFKPEEVTPVLEKLIAK